MKITFLAIAFTILLNHGVFSQEEQYNLPINNIVNSDRDQIPDIETLVREIKTNLNSHSKKIKIINDTEFSYSYRDKNDLILITYFSKDNYQNLSYVKEWYFQNRKLIFAQGVTTDHESEKVIDREKMYFENEHLFAWVQSEKYIDPNSATFKKTTEELKDYLLKLRIENLQK